MREIIKDGDEDAEYLEDEEVHEKRLLEQIAKIRRTANETEKIKRQLDGKRVQRRGGTRSFRIWPNTKIESLAVSKRCSSIAGRRRPLVDGLKRAMDRMQTLEEK